MLADDLAMAILVSSNDGYLSNFAIGSLKFPFCSKWPLLLIWRILFVNLEDPFLSEIRKNSMQLVVPFAKNATHPHQPPNDEIRLITTSIPKIKKLELLNHFLFFTNILLGCYGNRQHKIKCSKLGGGISGEKGAHSRKVLYLRSSEGNLCTITTHPHYPCLNKGN